MTGTGSDGIFLFFSQASPSTNTVHVTTWCTWHDNTISHTSLPSKYFQYAGASIKITSGGNDLRKCGVINGMYMMYLNIHAIMYSYVYCICIIYTYIHTHSIHIYIHNHTHSIHTHIYIYTVSQYFLMYIMRCTLFKNQFQFQGSLAAPTDWVPVADRRPDNRRSNFKPSQARLVCKAIFFLVLLSGDPLCEQMTW